MTTYTTGTTATLLRVSRETVRLWAEEFSRHLSDLASPGEGRHKQFTDNDLRILRTIADLKRSGSTFADIHTAIDDGRIADSPDMSVLSPLGSTTALTILERRVNDLTSELEATKAERDNARALLLPLERENAANRALRESMEARIAALENRISELLQENAVIKYRLSSE